MKSIETLEIPVIIAYFGGKPNYLKFALKSAANFNNTVVLIGDDTNKSFWRNHWNTTHIPHPKLSQREITERKNQSEHKNKHKERKKAFEKQ